MYAHSEFPPFHRVFFFFFVLQLIAQISSQNILLMIILRTHILIILIFSGFIGQIIFTITFTSTKNILYTSFNAVYRIYRIGIVQLSRMLLCAGIIFKILVLQKIRNIQRILIIRIRFTVIGGMAKTIRESKKFPFLFKRMLIIHVAPPLRQSPIHYSPKNRNRKPDYRHDSSSGYFQSSYS